MTSSPLADENRRLRNQLRLRPTSAQLRRSMRQVDALRKDVGHLRRLLLLSGESPGKIDAPERRPRGKMPRRDAGRAMMKRDRALFGVTPSRLHASLQRAPGAHAGVGGAIPPPGGRPPGGGLLKEDAGLELACRDVVAQLCDELSCRAHELVGNVKTLHTLALTVPHFELFVEEMFGILQAMHSRSGTTISANLGTASASAGGLKEMCREYRAFARDFNVAKLLLSGPASLAHRVLLFFQRFSGASSLRDVLAQMEQMQRWVRDTREFVDDLRSVFGVSPLCTTTELLDIVKAYVATFGLGPEI